LWGGGPIWLKNLNKSDSYPWVSPAIVTGASTSIIIGSYSNIGMSKLRRYSISSANRSAYSFLLSLEISSMILSSHSSFSKLVYGMMNVNFLSLTLDYMSASIPFL